MKEKENTHTTFKCLYCKKEFNEEWKKQAHMKIHKKYPCNLCDKTFKYLDIMKKHVLIVHEKAKLYCHFYNNRKTCPYDAECVFLHENSKLCKYGSMCDRNYCMFKHETNAEEKLENIHVDKDTNPNGISENEFENEVIEDILSVDEASDAQNERPTQYFEKANMTFTNPSQVDKSSSDGLFKCDKCGFASSRKDIIENFILFQTHFIVAD